MYERRMIKTLNVASTEDFFSTEEAADYLGVKPAVVRNYLWEGRFTTYKFKTLTLLSKEELGKYRTTRY
jgi:excisionase family DNA binding protein